MLIETEILHHYQEQAFRPVPQENSLFVEQAGKPVHKKLIENGARYQSQLKCCTILNKAFRAG